MKMYNYLNAALFFSLFPTVSICETVDVTKSQSLSKSLITENLNIESHSFVLVEFAENSSLLNQKAQQQLLDILQKDKSTSQLKQVIVLSWSDEEYPSTNLGELPMHQRDLAEKRNTSISHFI